MAISGDAIAEPEVVDMYQPSKLITNTAAMLLSFVLRRRWTER